MFIVLPGDLLGISMKAIEKLQAATTVTLTMPDHLRDSEKANFTTFTVSHLSYVCDALVEFLPEEPQNRVQLSRFSFRLGWLSRMH